MRQNEIITKDYVEILSMIEESMNKNLLRKGSMGKFLFKVTKALGYKRSNNKHRTVKGSGSSFSR